MQIKKLLHQSGKWRKGGGVVLVMLPQSPMPSLYKDDFLKKHVPFMAVKRKW